MTQAVASLLSRSKMSFQQVFTVDVNIFLYGKCGGTGYNATSWFKYITSNSDHDNTQTNVSGGYFHRCYGRSAHIEGAFRNYGKSVVNYGKSYALGNTGNEHYFTIQKLVAKPTEPKVLGMSMSWVFENVQAGQGVTLESESYFVITKE